MISDGTGSPGALATRIDALRTAWRERDEALTRGALLALSDEARALAERAQLFPPTGVGARQKIATELTSTVGGRIKAERLASRGSKA
jgi:hypothetical protein